MVKQTLKNIIFAQALAFQLLMPINIKSNEISNINPKDYDIRAEEFGDIHKQIGIKQPIYAHLKDFNYQTQQRRSE